MAQDKRLVLFHIDNGRGKSIFYKITSPEIGALKTILEQIQGIQGVSTADIDPVDSNNSILVALDDPTKADEVIVEVLEVVMLALCSDDPKLPDSIDRIVSFGVNREWHKLARERAKKMIVAWHEGRVKGLEAKISELEFEID